MANFNAVSDWSTTPASNTTVSSTDIGENCAIANLNNMGRAIMAGTKGALTAVTASGGDTYTASLSPAPDALSTASWYVAYFASANTSSTPTVNFNSLGGKTVTDMSGNALTTGSLNGYHALVYDGTNMRVLNPANYVSTNGSQGLSNKTLSSATLNTATINNATVNTATISNLTINGSSTNDTAGSGVVGEPISATLSSASAVSLTTDVTANVTSISLTAGDWDITGSAVFTGGASTTVRGLIATISSTTSVLGISPGTLAENYYAAQTIFTDGNRIAHNIPSTRLSLSTTTTQYLTAQGKFAVSTCSVYGMISARRRR